MRNAYRWMWVMLAALVTTMSPARAQEAPDSRGREFWLGFPLNAFDSSDGKTFALFISGDTATTVTVEVPGLEFSATVEVVPGVASSLILPAQVEVSDNEQAANLGVHVTAPEEVTVYGLSRLAQSTDAFLGLPVDVLGTDYVMLASGRSIAVGTFESQLLVVATQDATTVSIAASASDSCPGAASVLLNQGEAYRHRSCDGGDVSGTRVTASAPVAVYGAHECANIPSDVSFCDHLVEQLPPVSAWGRQFLTAPLATRIGGDTFRFLAQADGTELRIDGALVATLAAGEVDERVLATASRIDASQPVLVAQYSNSTEFDGVTSDPFMMLVPPFEQFFDRYTFAVPPEGFAQNFANVVVSEAVAPLLRLDGSPIEAASFTAIGDSGFVFAQLNLAAGNHTLTGGVAGLFAYGFDDFDSYGYPGGMSLSPIAQVGELLLAPAQASAQPGATHCVEARVLDDEGEPLEGIRVDFAVTGTHPNTGNALSDEEGVAAHCWAGEQEGADSVIASVGGLSASAAVNWQESTIQLLADAIRVDEGAGSVTITASRTGGTAGSVRARFATGDGSALAGSDYAAASGELVWADGEGGNKSFTVAITDDRLDEDHESFTVTLSDDGEESQDQAVAVSAKALGEPASAVVTIADDDDAVPVDVTKTSGGGGISPATLAGLLLLGLRRARHALALICLALLPAMASAAASDWYFGLRAGPTFEGKDSADLTADLRAQGHDVTAEVDDEDVGGTLYAGYVLEPRAALEFGYTRFGEYETRVIGVTAQPAAQLQRDIEQARPLGGHGLSATLRFRVALTRRLSLDPRLGLLLWRSESEVQGTPLESREQDEDGVGILTGVGLGYALTPAWSIGLGGELLRPSSAGSVRQLHLQVEYRLGQ